MTLLELGNAILDDTRKDANRPWWRRTTGGLYWAVVLAGLARVLAQTAAY